MGNASQSAIEGAREHEQKSGLWVKSVDNMKKKKTRLRLTEEKREQRKEGRNEKVNE